MLWKASRKSCCGGGEGLPASGERPLIAKARGVLLRLKVEACLLAWAGDDGICHFGGRVGGDSHIGHFGFSPKAARVVGRDSERHQCFVSDDAGQATVEYAVVLAGLLCVVAGLAALQDAFGSGLVTEHALAAASHHVEGSVGGLLDVFAY